MNCANTIGDGFHFWIGKMLAEVTVAIGLLATVLAILGMAILVTAFIAKLRKP